MGLRHAWRTFQQAPDEDGDSFGASGMHLCRLECLKLTSAISTLYLPTSRDHPDGLELSCVRGVLLLPLPPGAMAPQCFTHLFSSRPIRAAFCSNLGAIVNSLGQRCPDSLAVVVSRSMDECDMRYNHLLQWNWARALSEAGAWLLPLLLKSMIARLDY